MTDHIRITASRRQPSSEKLHQRQIEVAQDVAALIAAGTRCIFGVMVERRLHAGAQKLGVGGDAPRGSRTASAAPLPASAACLDGGAAQDGGRGTGQAPAPELNPTHPARTIATFR